MVDKAGEREQEALREGRVVGYVETIGAGIAYDLRRCMIELREDREVAREHEGSGGGDAEQA